jgi:hypothetical protein
LSFVTQFLRFENCVAIISTSQFFTGKCGSIPKLEPFVERVDRRKVTPAAVITKYVKRVISRCYHRNASAAAAATTPVFGRVIPNIKLIKKTATTRACHARVPPQE